VDISKLLANRVAGYEIDLLGSFSDIDSYSYRYDEVINGVLFKDLNSWLSF
jgi:hypothetical protein